MTERTSVFRNNNAEMTVETVRANEHERNCVLPQQCAQLLHLCIRQVCDNHQAEAQEEVWVAGQEHTGIFMHVVALHLLIHLSEQLHDSLCATLTQRVTSHEPIVAQILCFDVCAIHDGEASDSRQHEVLERFCASCCSVNQANFCIFECCLSVRLPKTKLTVVALFLLFPRVNKRVKQID